MRRPFVVDPLRWRAALTSTETQVAQTARRFADTMLRPRVLSDWRNGGGDTRGIMAKMGSAGLLGCTLPEEVGGAGLPPRAACVVAREIERVDSGYRSMLSVQNSLVLGPLHKHGTKEVWQRWGAALIDGSAVGCFGLTEPDAGSDPSSMRSRAVQQSDGDFVLNGTKTWISNSPDADVMVVWAHNSNGGSITGFVLEAGMPGLTTPPIHGKLGLRTCRTGQIVMDNVRVPASHMLQASPGLGAAFACLQSARLGIAWGALGAADECLRIAHQYALDRHQFNEPLAANQLVQLRLADMRTRVSTATMACVHGSHNNNDDEQQQEVAAVSLLKRNSCMQALCVAQSARDMLGGNGIVDEYHVGRHLLNLEVVNTYEGTQDIHALILGRHMTGIAAF